MLVGGALGCAAPGRAGAFTTEQAASGARIYARQCARCHGVNGEGKDNAYRGLRAPDLVGADALPCRPRAFQKIRQRDLRTVADIYAFVSTAMPADQPAILDADEYWNVLAYLLQRNGTVADGMRLSDSTARLIVLHPDCPPMVGH